MIEEDFNAAAASGKVTVVQPATPPAPSAPSTPRVDLSQFLPLLTALQSVKKWLSAAPTSVPQTFEDQLQFVFDGSNYYLYFYTNNQWNQVASSGGSGGPVISVNTKTGAVVLTTADIADSTDKRYVTDAELVVLAATSGTNTGDQTDATLPMSDITTNNVSITQHGFAPKAPNDATKYLDGTGAYSTPSGGGGGGGGYFTAGGFSPNFGYITIYVDTSSPTTNNASATKVHEIVFPSSMTPTTFTIGLRLSTFGSNSPAWTGTIQIYKNGVAYGTLHSQAGGGLTNNYADSLSFTGGDLCQVYMTCSNTSKQSICNEFNLGLLPIPDSYQVTVNS